MRLHLTKLRYLTTWDENVLVKLKVRKPKQHTERCNKALYSWGELQRWLIIPNGFITHSNPLLQQIVIKPDCCCFNNVVVNKHTTAQWHKYWTFRGSLSPLGQLSFVQIIQSSQCLPLILTCSFIYYVVDYIFKNTQEYLNIWFYFHFGWIHSYFVMPSIESHRMK